jgi:ketosteroid isomerase-like protein
LDAVRDFRVSVLKVSYVQGEDAVFAEFTAGATVISAGWHYQQDYILDLYAEAGKIAVLREYYDALRVVAAFNQVEGLGRP